MASLRKNVLHKNAPIKNTLAMLKCKLCDKPIVDTVARYQNAAYHIGCFRCDQCKVNLRNHKVYYDDTTQKMLCEACFIEMLDRCTVCGKEIFDEVLTLGDNQKFHRECFRCASCNELLYEYFFDYNQKWYCKNDYIKLCSPVCFQCKQMIEPDLEQQSIVHVSFQDQVYHPECFVCDGCGGSLDCESPCNVDHTNVDLNYEQTSKRINEELSRINKIFFPIKGQKLCRTCASNVCDSQTQFGSE